MDSLNKRGSGGASKSRGAQEWIDAVDHKMKEETIVGGRQQATTSVDAREGFGTGKAGVIRLSGLQGEEETILSSWIAGLQ